MIYNPVLRGFTPDPSIIRNGKDYYIATSTFEWWPGVRLFHSVNLVDFEQIPSPLRRYSQLDMTGNAPSCGVWAPDLTYDGQRYFLTYTDVKTKKYFYNTHNYLVYSDDIYGEWSEPVYLNSIGFDPSLLHDTDGSKYLVSMLNGFKGITVQKLDARTYKPTGERKLIYKGSGLRCTEGPHLYHIGEYYYLIVAEGGTGYGHCVTLARSENLYGPYETAPDNPIITSDKAGGIQRNGHGDLVITPDNRAYIVHLCSRPIEGVGCLLGRETAVQEMEWHDGWLRLKSGGKYACDFLNEVNGITQKSTDSDSILFEDDFSGPVIRNEYASPRRNYNEFARIVAHEGRNALEIAGQESINSYHRVSLLAMRQQEPGVSVRADMEYCPSAEERMAGIVYVYDALNFYMWMRTFDEAGRDVLKLIRSDKGVIETLLCVPCGAGKKITLGIDVDRGQTVSFGYGDAGNYVCVDGAYSTSILCDEYCRGFTGSQFGMYVHDLTGERDVALFTLFRISKN